MSRLESPPSFLEGVTLTAEEHEHFYNLSSNWLQLHSALPNLTEQDLRKILVMELASRRRMHIVVRIKRKHDHLRKARESNEVLKLHTLIGES